MPLRVLLADDQLMTLEGVRLVLEAAANISVVGEAHTAHELYSMVAGARPDLILVNPEMIGFEHEGAPLDILREFGDAIIVVFSTSASLADVEAALDAGAAAYIVKTIHPLSLPAALRATAEQTVFHARRPHASDGMAAGEPAQLTTRELEILAGLASGLSNKAISRELWVSEQTVKFHLTNIYRKLEVPNRTAAVRYAHQHHIVALQPAR
jgi:DNA-binding NarL/FixJ family response regulator